MLKVHQYKSFKRKCFEKIVVLLFLRSVSFSKKSLPETYHQALNPSLSPK